MKNYTHIWNSEFINNTKNIKNLNLCLEIGCFEGLTSNYIVDNILNSEGKLICVDPLKDVYISNNLSEKDHENNNTVFSFFKNQYDRFINNTKEHIESKKIELYRNLSSEVYIKLLEKYENKIDFIYIDGDHRASGVYNDAVNCFLLCKKNGVILFDDYTWGEQEYGEESTKKGIDKFLKEYEGQYEIMVNSYQYMIKKQ